MFTIFQLNYRLYFPCVEKYIILECSEVLNVMCILFFSNFIDGLCHAGGKKGMHFSDVRSDVRRIHYFNSAKGDTYKGVFSKLKDDFHDLQLIVAVLDRGTSYSEPDNYECSSLHVNANCMFYKIHL